MCTLLALSNSWLLRVLHALLMLVCLIHTGDPVYTSSCMITSGSSMLTFCTNS